MGDMDFGAFIFIGIIVIGITSIIKILTEKSKSGIDAIPYLCDSLLTRAELFFFNHIREEFEGSNYCITPKVRLGDIVLFKGGSDGQRWKRLNQVNRKHVDFTICDRVTMKPVFVIELDDSSHSRPDRRRRDSLVDSFLTRAGIPILHIRCQRRYRPELIDSLRMVMERIEPPSELLNKAGVRIVY